MKEATKNTLKYALIAALSIAGVMGLGIYLVEINKFVEAFCILFVVILLFGSLYITGVLGWVRDLFR